MACRRASRTTASRSRGRRRIGHSLRRENHQQPVVVRILGGDFDGSGVTLGIGVSQDVDGIAVAPVRRQKGDRAPRRSRQKVRRAGRRCGSACRCERAGTAGVGDDSQSRAAGAGLFGEHFSHVEQLADGFHAQHADAAKSGIEHFIAAGEGAGVGGGGFGGGVGATDFDDNDGLGQRHFARGGEESARVADGFHVANNAPGMRVVAEIVDEIAPADIEHRANRDEAAEADVFLEAPVEDGRAERAALADEGRRCRVAPSWRRTWR